MSVLATIKELIDGREAINLLLNKRLRAKTAYKVSKASRYIDYALRDFEPIRSQTRDKYGTVVGNTMMWKGETEEDRKINEASFREELDELMREQVEIPITPINPDELGQQETFEPMIFFMLDFLFEEQE